MRLDGKTALVTGADSGIGRTIALTFAREGADLAIHYHRDQRGAEQTATAIRQHGREAVIFQADFTDPSAAERLITDVLTHWPALDVLVNKPGRGRGSPRRSRRRPRRCSMS